MQALESEAARLVLGIASADDLKSVAWVALEAGADSPSLRELAGMVGDDAEEARGLFRQVMRELGVVAPSERDAVMRLSRELAAGVMRGEFRPYEAARRIWELTRKMEGDRPVELDPFVYGVSEWDEWPEDRPGLDADLRRVAEQFLREVDTGRPPTTSD